MPHFKTKWGKGEIWNGKKWYFAPQAPFPPLFFCLNRVFPPRSEEKIAYGQPKPKMGGGQPAIIHYHTTRLIHTLRNPTCFYQPSARVWSPVGCIDPNLVPQMPPHATPTRASTAASATRCWAGLSVPAHPSGPARCATKVRFLVATSNFSMLWWSSLICLCNVFSPRK